jgi:hypothetical protein
MKADCRIRENFIFKFNQISQGMLFKSRKKNINIAIKSSGSVSLNSTDIRCLTD